MEWEIVVGLELHAQLLTKSKIFSGAPNLFGSPSNTQACLVDLGMPGVLPVLNQDAIRMAIMFGLATNATIANFSVFARKNYFYPDLPKGYQISQLELPIVSNGHIPIEANKQETKRINITRAHLEEDAGKLLHEGFFDSSAVDFNRAGTPLLEIVSEPDLRSADEAVNYMKKIHSIVRYLDICDGNMQEGSFRCDVNISVRPAGQKQLGTRTEIKNLNSFRFVEQAINFEAHRQTTIIESGGEVIQETRLYDANKGETRSMRSKEEANDYRYFPDPDLLPVKIEQKTIDFIQRSLPELADNKKKRFIIEYGLSEYDAALLTSNREVSEYYEIVAEKCANPKLASNWVNGELTSYLNSENKLLSDSPVSALMLSQMLCRIIDSTITGKIAKTVFASMWNGEGSADEIIEKQELKQITDSAAIDKMINEIISNNQEQVKQFQSGKDKLMGFFIGQIMKLSKGKANPSKVEKILREKLYKKKEEQ